MLLMETIPVYSANRNILRRILAHLHQFSICDIQDASPDSQKDGSHLMWSQSCNGGCSQHSYQYCCN